MLDAEQYESTAADSERRLQEAKHCALAAGVQRVETRLLQGQPDVEILRAALEDSPDLIVIGMHRPVTGDRLSANSIALRLLQHSPYPVLTVKAFAAS